jgi:hypothetical protein
VVGMAVGMIARGTRRLKISEHEVNHG